MLLYYYGKYATIKKQIRDDFIMMDYVLAHSVYIAPKNVFN